MPAAPPDPTSTCTCEAASPRTATARSDGLGGLSAAIKAKDSYDWIASPLIFDLAFQRSGSAR